MGSFALRTPFFRLCVAYAAGILAFGWLPIRGLWLPLLAGAGLFWLLHYKINHTPFHLRWLFGCGVFLFLAALGIYRCQRQEAAIRFENLNKAGVFAVEVSATPKEKPSTYALQVRTQGYAADSLHFAPTRGSAILYLPKTDQVEALNIGDKLLVATTFAAPTAAGNPEEFDYPLYLHRRGIGAVAFVDAAHWTETEKATHISIRRMASDSRNRLLHVYKQYALGGQEFAVLAALTLGYRDDLSPDLYADYANSGAIHILSVSGLHVGIIYVVFAFLFSFLNRWPRIRFVKPLLIILLLWAYAFVTGLSPSVMRATLMFSLVALGSAFRYKPQVYNTVFFSAFVLLLLNPYYLFDIGFQLSYAAVLSILLLYPRLKNLLHPRPKPLCWAWQLFCVSGAAQVGTMPLSIYYFHQFPDYFFITNFWVIPLSTCIIYAAMLLFALHAVPLLGSALAAVLKSLLVAQNRGIEWISHLPFATSHAWLSQGEALLLYLALLLSLLYVSRKQYKFLALALGSLLAIQLLQVGRHATTLNSTQLVVYSSPQCTTVDFICHGRHQLFATDSVKATRMAQAFWLKQGLPTPENVTHTAAYHDGLVSFAGKRIGILTDASYQNKVARHKMQLDYLILGNKTPVSMQDVDNLFEVKQVIVDNTISKYRCEKIRQYCHAKAIRCYFLAEGGAYIQQL